MKSINLQNVEVPNSIIDAIRVIGDFRETSLNTVTKIRTLFDEGATNEELIIKYDFKVTPRIKTQKECKDLLKRLKIPSDSIDTAIGILQERNFFYQK